MLFFLSLFFWGGGQGKHSISNFIASKCWAFKITHVQLGTKWKGPRVPRHRRETTDSTATTGPVVLAEEGG